MFLAYKQLPEDKQKEIKITFPTILKTLAFIWAHHLSHKLIFTVNQLAENEISLNICINHQPRLSKDIALAPYKFRSSCPCDLQLAWILLKIQHLYMKV